MKKILASGLTLLLLTACASEATSSNEEKPKVIQPEKEKDNKTVTSTDSQLVRKTKVKAGQTRRPSRKK